MLKSKIEAILFLTDKPMRAQAIARIVNEDVQIVRQAILDLIHDYEERDGGLEIADDDGYMIQVKDQYASIIDEFVPMEMPVSLIRTLSAIAIKQPVPQSEIIKIRGAGAYDHIKELMTRELVIKKEDGRSPLLSTTKKFQEYFRLSQDAKSLRMQLRKDERVATKESEDGAGGDGGVAPNLHPESIEASQAKQLDLLFDSSPDASLVFRAEDLKGTAPSGSDHDGFENMSPSNASSDADDLDKTVIAHDLGASDKSDATDALDSSDKSDAADALDSSAKSDEREAPNASSASDVLDLSNASEIDGDPSVHDTIEE